MGTINSYNSTITNQSAENIHIGTQTIQPNPPGNGQSQGQEAILRALDLMLEQAKQSRTTTQEESQRICSALDEIRAVLLSDGNKETRMEKMSRAMNVLGGFSSTAALMLQIRAMIG